MGLDSLLATLESRAAETPETPRNLSGVSPKLLNLKAETPETPETPKNDNATSETAPAADTAPSRSVLSDEARALIREHKATLADLLPDADPAPRRLWLVTHLDGRRVSHSFTPGATLTEVSGWYPGAEVDIEDEPEAPEVEPDVPAPLVSCCTCVNWRSDQTGDGSGFGACLVSAPASKRPGSLWPQAEHICKDHRTEQDQ